MAPIDQNGQQLGSLLQQYPQNPQPVLEQIRGLADQGDPRARVMTAYLMPQQGRIPDGLSYAMAAARDGALFIANYYLGQVVGQPDPGLRSNASELLTLAATSAPGNADPYSAAQQLAQQGDHQAMQDLLDAALSAPPGPQITERIEAFLSQAQRQLTDLSESAGRVSGERDRVIGEMTTALTAVQKRHDEVDELAREIGGLASDTAAEIQAREYGERAKTVEERANLFTGLSVGLAVLIALASLGVAIEALAADDGLESSLQKAGFAIPFLFLNVYLARLAGDWRREALRWRHIELQLQTATPFLGALEPERRQDVVAMLALRFFPGQGLPAAADGSEGDAPDDADALASIVNAARKIAAPAPAPPGPSNP